MTLLIRPSNLRPPLVARSGWAACALLLASGCGSSSSPQDEQDPGGAADLPESFAVFLSDREASGNSRPHLVDPENGTIRSLGGSLQPNEDVYTTSSFASPDGRFVAINTGDGGVERLRFINCRTGASRNLTSLLGNGLQRQLGGETANVNFSASSQWALIQADFNTVYVAEASGANPRQVTLQGEGLRDVQWLPSSDRFAARTYDSVAEVDTVTIFDAATLSTTTLQPLPAQDMYVDRVLFSRDESLMVLAGELAPGSSGVLEVIAIHLESGRRTMWQFDEVDEDDLWVSDHGDFIAAVTSPNDNDAPAVFIHEVVTGVSELASLPAGVSMGTGVHEVQWEPGGTRLAILSDHRLASADEVTLAEFGRSPFAVEPTLSPDAEVEEMLWDPRGRWLVYWRSDLRAAGTRLFAFDADSTALPQAVGDPLVSVRPLAAIFSPDGGTLLASERDATTFEGVTVAYTTGDWSAPHILGPAFEGHSPTPSELQRGAARVAFSADSRSVYWIPPASFAEAQRLLWLSLDSPTGTAPTEIVGPPAAGTTPRIERLWVR